MLVLVLSAGDTFEWALRATSLLALAIGIVAYLKGGAREITIKMQEEAIAIRDVRVADLAADVGALHEKNRGLTEKVRVLEGVATSAAEIERLSREVKSEIGGVLTAIRGHHTEMLGVTTGLQDKLEGMIAATEHLESALGGLPLAIASAIRGQR